MLRARDFTRMKRDEHGELDCCRLDPSLGSAVLPPCMDTKPYKEEQMTEDVLALVLAYF